MKEIPLPCGKVAVISDEDWDKVQGMSWYDRGDGYVAARHKRSLGGNGRLVPLHHFVLGKPPAGYVVDHIDGNPLNNQQENLQLATLSRNSMKSTRALRGGIYQRSATAFEVRLRVDRRIVRVGSFGTIEEAEAVLAKARESAWSTDSNKLNVRMR